MRIWPSGAIIATSLFWAAAAWGTSFQDPATSPNPGLALIESAARGDTARVEALINAGADLDSRDAEGTTALMASSRRGHASVVQMLINAGADRMATDSAGRTARYWAAGWSEVIRILETGAGFARPGQNGIRAPRILTRIEPQYTRNARLAGQQGRVILDAVVRADGTVAIMDVRQSLGYGLDESAVDALSQWTFEPGSRDGEPVDVRVSIEVNFSLGGFWTQGSLFAAAARGDRRQVEDRIEAGDEVDSRDGAGRTPVYLASENGQARIVRILLEAGADPEVPARNGTTPLMVAALRGDEGVTRELLGGGADVDRANDDGVTPLIAASIEGKEHLVEMLLEARARTELRTRDGTTALIMASIEGEEDVVSVLLEGGANPNLATPAGITPLLVAAEKGHEDIVEMLLDAGADFRHVADNGATALRVAITQDHSDIVRLLREARAEW